MAAGFFRRSARFGRLDARGLAILLGALAAGRGARAAAPAPAPGGAVPAVSPAAIAPGPAAPASPAPPPAVAPAPAPPALVVVVSSDDAGLDPEIVRLAISNEVAAPAVLAVPELVPDRRGVVTVALSRARGELTVSYQERGRGAVVRVLPAPPRIEDVVEYAAWMAGNLARDEARELLGATPPNAPSPVVPPSLPLPAPPPPAARTPGGVAAAAAVRAPAGEERLPAPIALSLIYPIATNFDAPGLKTRLALNLLYGRVGAVDGLGLGVVNQVDGDMYGIQAALAVNVVGGPVRGLQLAEVANIAGGDVHGLQGAFVYNQTRGSLQGLDAALVNDVRGAVDGAEVGAVNRAGDVHGFQLGLINVANQVHGAQIGLINVADDVSGVPIGLISVTRTGGIHPLVWSSTTSAVNAGLKFSTHQTYTELSASATNEDGIRMYGPGLALGARLPFQRIIIETDLGASYLFGGPLSGVSRHDGLKDDMAVGAWRARVGLELERRFTMFVGGGVAAKIRFYQPPEAGTVAFGTNTGTEVTGTVHFVPHLFAGVQL
jgi:hypothetical protein